MLWDDRMRIPEQGLNEAWSVTREGVPVSKATTGPVPTGQNNAIVTGKYTEPLPTASPETKNINYIVIMKEEHMCIYILEIWLKYTEIWYKKYQILFRKCRIPLMVKLCTSGVTELKSFSWK